MQFDDFDYFIDNTEDFYRQYGKKFLAIKHGAVLGVYDNFMGAVKETAKSEELGTFIVQKCLKNREDGVVHFQSNVAPPPARACL